MFGIGETELVIILIFAFLLFGPDKLPGMGRTLGRVLRQFREASEGFTEVVQTNIVDPATQELNNTGSTKRTPAAAQKSDVDDEDADIEDAASGEEKAAPPKRETFAERKARLEAERKAREEAAEAEAASPEISSDEAGDDDADADLPQEAVPTPAPASQPSSGSSAKSPEKPKGASIEELYSRPARKSPRSQSDDAQPASTDVSDAAHEGEEDGSEA